MIRRCLAATGCILAALPLVTLRAQTTPELAPLLRAAGEYVTRFIEQFSNVVAEEVYVQDSLGTLPPITVGRGFAPIRPASRTREVKSDFLLVKIAAG